jgi:hypothetical protein
MRVPGPATLGPGPQGAINAGNNPGGVAGVSMSPVSGIAPPAGPGGPHALPPLPQAPLPQGFPNPFAMQQVGQNPPGAPGLPPGAPGTMNITGPMGYLPGIGQFGTPNPAGASLPGPLGGAYPAIPQLPQPGQAQGQPQFAQGQPQFAQGQPRAQSAPPPSAFPVLPGAIHLQPQGQPGQAPAFAQPGLGAFPQAGPGAFPPPAPPGFPQPAPAAAFHQPAAAPGFFPQGPQPQPQPQGAAPPPPGPAQQPPAQPNPFWLQLAWQLVQTPAVKQRLADRHPVFVEGEDRMKTLQLAASLLAGPELQQALRAMTTGSLDQNRFTGLFADALTRSLDGLG